MKLWEKVNNLCGCGGKSRILVEHLNQASKWVVNSLPEKFLWSVASTSEVTDSDGSGIAYDKILSVYRQPSSPLTDVVTNTPSAGTAYSFTKASHGLSVSDTVKLSAFTQLTSLNGLESQIATVADASTFTLEGVLSNGSTAETSSSPDEGGTVTGPNVVKRIAKEVPDSQAYAFEDSSGSLNRATSLFPKYYKLEGKIWIKPDPTTIQKGVIVYAAPPVVDENTDSWVLAEYENIVLMYAGSLDFLRQSESNQILVKTELTTVDGLVSSYSSEAPTYVSPTLPTLATLSMPSAPSQPVFSYNAPSGFTLPKALENVPSNPVMAALPSVPTVTLPSVTYFSTSVSTDIADANTHLTNEDPELVASRMQIIGAQLQEYGTDIQNNMNDFNKQNAEREAKLRQYQQDITKYQQEVGKTIQKFGADVSDYQAQVGKVTQDAQTELASYDREQRDAVQAFTKELEQHRAEVGRYQAEAGAKVQEHQRKVSTELEKFQALIQEGTAAFNVNMQKAKRHLESAAVRMQIAQQYSRNSAEDFQKSQTLYGWATSELRAVTGGQSAPSQQQVEQRGEERASTQ